MEETTELKRLCHSLHTPQLLAYLPFDVIVEILCRLPAKFLLQLCCVCKSWNALISNDLKFAKKHLRMSTKHHHLIRTRWFLSKEIAMISYPLDSIPLHSILTSKGTQLNYPPTILRYQRYRLVDSCDGLLCFHINDDLVYIYNPCIRKVKKLPYLGFPHVSLCCQYAFGFGYDPFIDNYKVIVVFSYDVQDNDCKSEVKVHTLGTDSWRSIKDFPSKVPYGRSGIFVSGTVNWLTHYNSNGFNDLTAIVSLHLGKESCQEIPQPDYGNFGSLALGVMRDCLCIFSHGSDYSTTDVWLMKEYGNKDSWSKLIRLPYFGSSYSLPRILYISDNNHVLLVFEELDKLTWVVYDSKNNNIMSSEIEDLSRVESTVYVESLILP